MNDALRISLSLVVAGASTLASAQPANDLEFPLLSNHVRLTSPEDFVKAGESYFSPDSNWIIFQAIPRPEDGKAADPHYSMYVAEIARDTDGRITGINEPLLISEPDSANTCGWFAPDGSAILFGSTTVPPAVDDRPGYQRRGSRYSWQFPREMEVVSRSFPLDASEKATPIFERDGYDAECSYSPDGRFVLYAHAKPVEFGEKPDADIWVYDIENASHTPLIIEAGYDGGPFFSPDGKRICYRSDRENNDQLQLFIADLEYDENGVPIAAINEQPLTDNTHVNWAPFFHPSGEFMVFTSSALGHFNYEVVSIALPPIGTSPSSSPRMRRITFGEGFDGLPVFNADGTLMMWTSQRTVKPGEAMTSQVWVAQVDTNMTTESWTGGLDSTQAMSLVRAHMGDPTAILGALPLGNSWRVQPTDSVNTSYLVDRFGNVTEETGFGGADAN